MKPSQLIKAIDDRFLYPEYSYETACAVESLLAHEYYGKHLNKDFIYDNIIDDIAKYGPLVEGSSVTAILTDIYEQMRESSRGAVILNRFFMSESHFAALEKETGIKSAKVSFLGKNIYPVLGEEHPYIVGFGHRKFNTIGIDKCLVFGKIV